MEKAKVVAAILLLVSLTLLLTQTGVSEVNYPVYPSMYIKYPESYQETVYQNISFPIQVYAYADKLSEVQCVDIFYSIDDSSNRTLSLSKMESIQERTVVNFAYGTLDNLSFGFHSIKAYSTYTQGEVLSTSVKFFVNATSNNPLTIVSPLNATYNNTEVPITYIIDNQLTVEYSLDNAGYVSSDSNLTLIGLSQGQHILAVKAVSQYGTYSEQTVNFTVLAEEAFSSEIVLVIVDVAIVTVVVIIISLLLYGNHRKTTNSDSNRL